MELTGIKKMIESMASGNGMSSDPGNNVCPVCNGSGWEVNKEEQNVGESVEIVKVARRCRACNGDHARRVSDTLIRADIPENRSFADFDWTLYGEDLTRQERIVNSLVDRFPYFEMKRMGLFITSETRGAGKTLLASAVGGELIKRYEVSTRFVSVSNLIEISKQRRDDGADPLSGLISCRVLILDDLGQQRTGRDWLTDILFRVIDERYRAGKMIIVTSNVELKKLDFDIRLLDRLNDMTMTVKLPEYCVRAREANTRKHEMLRELGIE